MATAAMSTNWGFQIAILAFLLLASVIGVLIPWLAFRKLLLSRADGQLAERLRKGYGTPVVFAAKVAVVGFVSATICFDGHILFGESPLEVSPVTKYSLCIPFFISLALMMRIMQRAAARADAEVGKSEA